MSIKILTAAHVAAFKRLGKQDKPDAKVVLKLFLPTGGCTWYITEYDPATGLGFGFANLGDPEMAELGYIDLYELINLRRHNKVDPSTPLTEVRVGNADCCLGVERDIHFEIGSVTMDEVIRKIKSGGHV